LTLGRQYKGRRETQALKETQANKGREELKEIKELLALKGQRAIKEILDSTVQLVSKVLQGHRAIQGQEAQMETREIKE
jgi:hypothetical protein